MKPVARRLIVFAILPVAGFLASCSHIDEPAIEKAVVKEEGDKILIVDQLGEEWDITHAVNKYNMRPDLWEQGVGANTILPLINPKMVSPGERGYPPPDWIGIVIGTTIAGESRAYAISDINAHEVVDETFVDEGSGEVHVAVGW